jgi:23S rRNA (cytosine1962-C5)-methyltransferase
VNRKAEQRIAGGHPWIYRSDVLKPGTAQPGDVVRVVTDRGRLLGLAHFSSTSQITLRLLTKRAAPIDRNFFLSHLKDALAWREKIVRDSDSYRLVHAEADGLPGLIIDRYADYLVVQLLDQGMDRSKSVLVDCLNELIRPKGILARNDVPARKHENLPPEPEVLAGEIPERIEIRFNGLQWQTDLRHGQKTGIYLDQRENYPAVAKWAKGRALDCFTSTGGFALHMAPNCDSIEAVDSSAPALEAAKANAAANGITNVSFREANVFDLLSGYAAAQRHFDTIVLDPPSFSKTKANLEAAHRGYKEINYKALKLLSPGGILATCSCSHHMSESELLSLVAEAALDCGRTLRILERRTQAQDHPILLTVPETMYLKCLVFQAL